MFDRAIADVSKVKCGGKPIAGPGYRSGATVMADIEQYSEIMQKENFGPVLPVMKFETFCEALSLANDFEFFWPCHF